MKLLSHIALKKAILLGALPCLASRTDAIATVELVKIALRLEQEDKIAEHGNLGNTSTKRSQILAITFLSRVVMANPKVWPDFVSMVEKYFGNGFTGDVDLLSTTKAFEIDLSIVSAFVELVEFDGELFAGRIMALLYHKIERIADSGIKKNGWYFLTILMKAVLACSVHGGIGSQEIWPALGLHSQLANLVVEFLSAPEHNQSNDSHYSVLLTFIELFGQMPNTLKTPSGTEAESKYQLYTEILTDFLFPLSTGLLQKAISNDFNELVFRVVCTAFDAISNYPSELWFEKMAQDFLPTILIDKLYNQKNLIEPEGESFSVISCCSKYLAVLMDKEAEMMRRSVLRGTDGRTLGNQTKDDITLNRLKLNLDDTYTENANKNLYKASYTKGAMPGSAVSSRVAYLGKVFKAGGSAIYGNVSILAMSYLAQREWSSSASNVASFGVFKQDLVLALNDILISSEVYPISETMITLFKNFFEGQNQRQNVGEIFGFLVSGFGSQNSLPHVRINSIYALGGLVKYTNLFNPKIASAFSEQCLHMLKSYNGTGILPSNRSVPGDSYWTRLTAGSLSFKEYIEDGILAAAISSGVEWCLSTPGDFSNQAELLNFMSDRIKSAFNPEILLQNRFSLLACSNGIIGLIDLFDERSSSAQNEYVSLGVKKVASAINSLPIFGSGAFTFASFGETQHDHPSNQKSWLDVITESNLSLVLQSVLSLVCVVVRLQLHFLPTEIIIERHAISDAYLNECGSSIESLSLFQVIEMYSHCAYMCISSISLIEAKRCYFYENFNCIEAKINLIESLMGRLKYCEISSKIKNIDTILNNLIATPLSGLFASMKQSTMNSTKLEAGGSRNVTNENVHQYFDKKCDHYRAIFLLKLKLLQSNSGYKLQSSLSPPKLISESGSYAMIGLSILNGLIPFNVAVLGFQHSDKYQIYDLQSTLYINKFLDQTVDEFIGIPKLDLHTQEHELNHIKNTSVSRELCWILAASCLHETSCHEFNKKKPSTGGHATSLEKAVDNTGKLADFETHQNVLSSLASFGSSDPENLSRLAPSSVCRKTWEKLIEDQKDLVDGKIPNNQVMLWVSLLLMKWPFPLVDGLKKIMFHFENSTSLEYKLVVLLVLSKWSSYMYSSTKGLVLTLISSVEKLNSCLSPDEMSTGSMFAENVLGEYGLGKILELGGLGKSKSIDTRNSNSLAYTQSSHLSLCEKQLRNFQTSVLYKIGSYTDLELDSLKLYNADLGSFEKSSGKFRDLHLLLISNNRQMVKIAARDPKKTPAARMQKQLNVVSVPSSIIKNVVLQVTLLIKSSKYEKSSKIFVRALLHTLENHYFDNKRRPTIDNSLSHDNHEDITAIGGSSKVENPLSVSLTRLKSDLANLACNLFQPVYEQKLESFALFNLIVPKKRLNLDLSLVCSYIDATSIDFESLASYSRAFAKTYESSFIENELEGDLNYERDFDHLIHLMESLSLIRLVRYTLKQIYYEGHDFNINYQILTSRSLKLIDDLLRTNKLVFESTNKLAAESFFIWTEGPSSLGDSVVFERVLQVTARIRANAICSTIPFALLPSSASLDRYKPGNHGISAITTISFAHLVKILDFAGKALDLVVLNVAKLAKMANSTEDQYVGKGHNKREQFNACINISTLQRQASEMATVLLTDFVGPIVYSYFETFKNLNKPLNSYNVCENLEYDLDKLSGTAVDYSLMSEGFSRCLRSQLEGFSLLSRLNTLATPKLDLQFLVQVAIPKSLAHYLGLCKTYQKTRNPEYIATTKVTGIQNLEKQAQAIGNRVLTIYQALLFLKMPITPTRSDKAELDSDISSLVSTLGAAVSLYYKTGIIDQRDTAQFLPNF